MTQPTAPHARTFLSYRQSRMGEARLLVQSLHEHGVPTWQDVDDLAEEPIEERLRQVLSGDEVGGAVLWLTPEVADSPMVRQVEAPAIVRRAREDAGFFVVPVAAGGLDYRGASQLLDGVLGADELKAWKIRRVQSNPLTPNDARQVAGWVLQRRVAALHSALPPDAPLRLDLGCHRPPTVGPATAFPLDWSPRFERRQAPTQLWHEALLPALSTVREAVRARAPGRQLLASGTPTLSAAVALGRAFSRLDTVSIAWEQATDGRNEPWSFAVERQPCGFVGTSRAREPGADNAAILLSVTRDVEPAFARTALPSFRSVTHLHPEPKTFDRRLTAGEAADLVELVIRTARKTVQDYPASRLHFFLNAPAGVAFLIGQALNTLGSVQLYEHMEDDAVGRYLPSVLLPERWW